MALESFAILAIGIMFPVVGIGLTGIGLLRLRRWVRMRRLDPSDGIIEPGLCEVEGTARPIGEPIRPPFSGSESVVCEHEVERYEYNENATPWDTRERDTETVAFEVEHDGPTVAVDARDAQHLLTEEFQIDTAHSESITPRMTEYLDDGVDWLSRRHRFTERRLDAGEDVYVLGEVTEDQSAVLDDSDARYLIEAGELGRLDQYVGSPFVVADVDEGTAIRRQLKSGLENLVSGLLFLGLGVMVLAIGGYLPA